jgi:signal transduction histidine kinase
MSIQYELLERQMLRIIIIIFVVFNILGFAVAFSQNPARGLAVNLVSAFIQIAALMLNEYRRSESGALLLSLSLLYTGLLTALSTDLANLNNNPMIPVAMASIFAGAFSYHPRRTLAVNILAFSVPLLVMVANRVEWLPVDFPGSQANIEIGQVMIYVMFVIPSVLISLMNRRRLQMQQQIQASTRRLISGERMKGASIMIPAMSHELAGPVGNALSLVGLLEENREDPAAAELMREALDTLKLTLGTLSSSLERYKRQYRHDADEHPDMDMGRMLSLVVNQIGAEHPEDKYRILPEGEDSLMLSRGEELVQVLYDILRNSVEHGRVLKTRELSVSVRWKVLNLGDDPRYAVLIQRKDRSPADEFVSIRIADNGPGFDRPPAEYLQAPVMKSYHRSSRSTLGLYLSRVRVEHYFDGAIIPRSWNAAGSELEIMIPGNRLIRD